MGKKKAKSSSAFKFIQDARLRADVEDALYFTTYLIDAAAETKSKRYKEEFYRAVVLYIASVIEALCLAFIATQKLTPKKFDYKHERTLTIPDLNLRDGELICAIKVEKVLTPEDTPFIEAIRCLDNEKLLSSALTEKIHNVRLARNTQHLYSRQSSRMTYGDVENALNALIELLTIIQRKAKG